MKGFLAHVRTYVIRGLFASIPIFLSYLAFKFIYVFIDKKVNAITDQLLGFHVPGLGLLLAVVIFYFFGLLASNVIGRQLFKLLEGISSKIPIIKTIYQVGKQLSSTLSLPEKQVFKKPILIDILSNGIFAVGFVTGTLKDKSNQDMLRVFVPHVPNPTVGFVIIVRESLTIDPHWTIDEAMRLVISGGIIGPDLIRSQNSAPGV